MLLVSIGTEDGVIGILGITPEDIDRLILQGATQPLDLRRNFAIGLALPTMLQIVYGESHEAIEARIEEAVQESGGWDDERGGLMEL